MKMEKVMKMPSNTPHDASLPEVGDVLAEDIVVPFPEGGWVIIKSAGDVTPEKFLPRAAADTVLASVLAEGHGRHLTVNPRDDLSVQELENLVQGAKSAHTQAGRVLKTRVDKVVPCNKKNLAEAQREVQVEAAQLKEILDGRLKRKTAQWIKDLARS